MDNSRAPVLSEDGTLITIGAETITIAEAMSIYHLALSAKLKLMASTRVKVTPCDKQCVSCLPYRPSAVGNRK
ncbi:MAG: hypothetical protein WC761_00110 [Candidatus Paceibacterota bacterium]|jgi:hypothetical protein